MEPQNRYGPRDDYSTLPGPVDLFRETWPQYTKNLKKLIVIQLGPRILTFITVFLSTLGLLNLFNFLIRQLRLGESLFVLSFPFVFVFVLGVAIEAFLLAAMIHVIKQEDGGIGIIESYRRSWNNILSYWWVLALSAAIMVGGLFLFVIPAVIFIIWFSLGIFVAVNEDRKGLDALLKSREYIKGFWFAVLFRFLAIGIPIVFVSLVLDGIGNFLAGSIDVLKFGDRNWVSETIIFVWDLFATPFFTIYSFIIYKKLKSIKGEFLFAPSKKSKVILGIVCILGVVGVLLFIPLVFQIALAALLGPQS